MSSTCCEGCGDENALLDPEFEAVFRVSVCNVCKDSNPLYTVITKTQARSEFLLTDEELADSALLPSVSRRNPHNPRWSDMKLYLRKQCRDFALHKFGSEGQLKAAIAARVDNKTDRKSKKFLKKLKGKEWRGSHDWLYDLFVNVFIQS